MSESIKKVVDFFVPFLLVVCCVVSLVFSITAFRKVETLHMEMFNVGLDLERISNHIDSIEDDIVFIRSWCSSAPSVTLGDTYINQTEKNSKSTDNSKSIVNNSKKSN